MGTAGVSVSKPTAQEDVVIGMRSPVGSPEVQEQAAGGRLSSAACARENEAAPFAHDGRSMQQKPSMHARLQAERMVDEHVMDHRKGWSIPGGLDAKMVILPIDTVGPPRQEFVAGACTGFDHLQGIPQEAHARRVLRKRGPHRPILGFIEIPSASVTLIAKADQAVKVEGGLVHRDPTAAAKTC